jgi:glycosyltransferase involved in cell wall biosynthesis
MKILHVLSAFREQDGGPPRSVGGLCGALADNPATKVKLLFGENNPRERAQVSSGVHIHPIKCAYGNGLKRFNSQGFGRQLGREQVEFCFDIIHSHGLWLKSNHEVSVTCRRLKLPIVISPRGMLEPWALNNRYWKKRLALFLYGRKDLRSATAFHATAQSEADSIRRLGFKQPIAVIPNGVVLPDIAVRWSWLEGEGSRSENEERRMKDEEQTKKTALFLSRINPKKGLPMLLDAWAKLAPVDWRLVIAGNDDANHFSVVERKIRELGLQDHVKIAGPLFGDAKEAAYRQADIFVLPSYSENFGIVVAEALGYGLPVLTTTGCPWQELQTHNCGWWVEPTTSGIEHGLSEALRTKNEELSAMGRRGRQLVEQNYQWPAIAEKMLAFYEWILNGGNQPDFVV